MKPNIKNYLNVYQYLKDLYSYKKKINSKFSYQVWANELSIKNKAYLRLIILGQRPLTEEITKRISNSEFTTKDEKNYFSYLVEYTQSTTQEQKSIFGKKIASFLKNNNENKEIINQLEFLSDPLLPKLQVLMSFIDLDQSYENLAWLLNCDLKQVSDSINKLLELGLIKKENDRFYPNKSSFQVPDQFKNLALKNYYISGFKAAEEAIDLPQGTRRFRSLLLPLNNSEFLTYLDNFQEYVQDQLSQFNSDEIKDRRLYQVHFHIIPITKDQNEINKPKENFHD